MTAATHNPLPTSVCGPPLLSLVIPCFNEAAGLPELIRRLTVLHFADNGIEVVLVDNGSSDESKNIIPAAAHQYSFISALRVENNQGYGYGILQGLAVAAGQYLGWTHADMQTDPLDALMAVSILKAHSSPEKLYLKGRRYARTLFDNLFTAGMSVLESSFFRAQLWDINAQPNIFHRSFYDGWINPPHDFSLDLYAYAGARLAGLEVVRFPVLFTPRLHGVSHWNFNWQAKIKFIRRTLAYSLQLRKNWR
jgi:glycosyltransferase involved in cell wall biosynthesis